MIGDINRTAGAKEGHASLVVSLSALLQTLLHLSNSRSSVNPLQSPQRGFWCLRVARTLALMFFCTVVVVFVIEITLSP